MCTVLENSHIEPSRIRKLLKIIWYGTNARGKEMGIFIIITNTSFDLIDQKLSNNYVGIPFQFIQIQRKYFRKCIGYNKTHY